MQMLMQYVCMCVVVVVVEVCVCNVLILPMKPGNFGGRKKTDFYIVSCLLSDLSNESRFNVIVSVY